MNNFQIHAILKANAITRKKFIGVFNPSDLTRVGSLSKGCLIINLCEKGGNLEGYEKEGWGCHWLGVAITPSKMIYMDPSGVKSYFLNSKIKKFLINQHRTRNIINTTCIQPHSSNLCGLYCIIFIYFMCKGRSLSYFLSLFDKKNISSNDEILLKLFNKYFKKLS